MGWAPAPPPRRRTGHDFALDARFAPGAWSAVMRFGLSFGRRTGRLPAAAIGLAILAAYWGVWNAPFVFDDTTSIPANPTIRTLWPPWAPLQTPAAGGLTVTGRPILNLSLALNYAVSGKGAWSYHLANLVIHAAAALLLFGIIRRTAARLNPGRGTEPDLWALAAALLWALHPLQTSAVTYVIQRAESLAALFYLATLYSFVRAAEGRTRWAAVSVGACLLGMGTKETMVSAPLLVLLYDRTLVSGSFRGALRARPAYYAALAASWLPLGALVLKAGGNRAGSIGFGVGVGWWAHALTQGPAILRYLALAFWPHPLVFEYEPVWAHGFLHAGLPAIALLGLAGLSVWAIVRRSIWGVCGAAFFAVLAPSSLLPSPSEFIVEYRMYLPLAAVVALAAGGLWRLLGARGAWVLLAAAAALGAVTARRNADYRSAVALWADTVAKRPANALAHEMLGEALDAAGRRAEGLEQHAAAVRLRPDLAIAQDQLGDDLCRAGDLDEAIAHYEAAIGLDPNAADPHDGLGRALARMGDYAEAIQQFETAIRAAPDFAGARLNLADARYNLGNLLAQAGRPAEAAAQYRAALRLRPDFARAHYNLGNALAASRDYTAALSEYAAALRLKPDFADAECNLAATYAVLGRRAEAIAHYQAALRLRPDFADVREALRRLGSAAPGN